MKGFWIVFIIFVILVLIFAICLGIALDNLLNNPEIIGEYIGKIIKGIESR